MRQEKLHDSPARHGPAEPPAAAVSTLPAGAGTGPRVDLRGLTREELAGLVAELGEKPYRGRQLWSWIHDRGAADFAAMTDLPRSFRERLEERASVAGMSLQERVGSPAGKAVKFLFEVPGGGLVEAVYISDGTRRTACLSSQVGCPLDCRFCATAKMGFLSNLGAGEIVDQFLQLQDFARSLGERVTHIVMMGMGEPLLNYDQVVRALRIIRSREGGIGGRRITVSTAGYVPGIRRLADEDLNVGLAISLNATDDETRTRLMPINRKFPIAELLEAGRLYYQRRGRRVTFEYVLMAGVTDSDRDAVRLASLSRQLPCKINLIPYNELSELPPGEEAFERPSRLRVRRFAELVRANTETAVTVRESRGGDIDAACGQLYRRIERPARRRSPG